MEVTKKWQKGIHINPYLEIMCSFCISINELCNIVLPRIPALLIKAGKYSEIQSGCNVDK